MSKIRGFNVLIVDDEIEYQNVLSIILQDAGYITNSCSNGLEALDFLKENAVDLVVTDLKMPHMDGIELIKSIKEQHIETQVIVMTAFGSIESAVSATKYGAEDYFVKSNDMDELLKKIERMARLNRLEKKSSILLRNQNSEEVFFDTKNKEYYNILEMCQRTANTGINILLLGESGVGKEVIANYIHRISDRKTEPFIALNCQNFPETIIESELFGHEKGSFTGAVERRIGKFEEANYGTLFLDEIGDLPLSTQGKLLRVLESRAIERIGSNKLINLDIRLVSATNKNLTKDIQEGLFREDLLYRINTLTLPIPPLRERREDLPGLIEFFIKKIEKDQKKIIKSIDERVMKFLLEYNYPGNVRELRNIIERMIALSKNGEVTINEILMPIDVSTNQGAACNISDNLSLREARAQFEAEYIKNALDNANGNVSKCADGLGITTRQLWNKIGQYNIGK